MTYMTRELLTPDYIFEASWEVCNKVGGIYTVLSTRANTLQNKFRDRVIFIGPDFWQGKENPLFVESDNLCAAWKKHATEKDQLAVRVGRWQIPGEPIVILVDFQPFYSQKNEIYTEMWNRYQVDSLHAYGDYDEASMFAYAAGRVVESFYRYNLTTADKVVFQAHEWMTGMGALYLKTAVPEIATIFTTHATSIGRSIAGNDKPLYDYLFAYNGDQMAVELNMQSKHSIEKQTAHNVDCFTTVSDITARECKQLLDKEPDIVTPNGFEPNFVPEEKEYVIKRAEARKTLLRIAEKLIGSPIDPDALLISTSGRYEYRNKGIDVFITAMNRVRTSGRLQNEAVVFIMVPAWVREPRADLQKALELDYPIHERMQCPYITHWLNQMQDDRIINYIGNIGFRNSKSDKLKIIFIPCYLDGKDGILNKPYYDILIGMDVTVYPSYYEPWGYTPLESVAFGIPTITTNLAGFGLWAKKACVSGDDIQEGVAVIERTDFNYFEVVDAITEQILKLSETDKNERKAIKERCFALAKKAEWSKFIAYYQDAFSIALANAAKRNC